ncbi:cytochrome P450 [Diplogelasinospora grovesii]|uniref:Cytochrome P450 n=1 Tax=Diplogelasinospora grovesii TaxID=303347 RepID=A0AAN6MYZ0_9PEZI|nr:cytochrome P450 [Diplogelasinospora grovesii]
MEFFNRQGSPLYLYGAAAGLLFVMATAIYSILKSPLSHVPGPWYTRYTGLVLAYHWLNGSRCEYIHQLHQKYGPVVRVTPVEADICSVSAKQQIYAVKERYIKSSWYTRLVGGAAQAGSLSVFSTQDIDTHRRYRRLLSSPLSESSLKTVEPTIRSRVDLALERMTEELKVRGVMDVYKWSMFMTTDVIGELTFGQSFRMLELPLGQKSQYIEDLQTVSTVGAYRTTFPTLMRFLQNSGVPTPWHAMNRAAEAGRNIRSYAMQSLERYRRLVESGEKEVKQTLFTKVFKAEEEETMKFNEIVANAQTYIVAGSDTTAHSLTYLLWSVCKDPTIQDRLVQEVQQLPDDDNSLVDHDLWDLPYLNRVIDETLRLYTAAPAGLPRLVPPEGDTLDGYWFKGGTVVATQAYSLHRDPEIYPEPEKFDPDRWANPTRAMKDAFMPFGGGARICIGLHLAKMELRLATALFFRRFPNARVSEMEGMCDEDMQPSIYFLLGPKGKRCLIQAE